MSLACRSNACARPNLSRHRSWVSTYGRKWSVAHPILSLHSFFLFLFRSTHYKTTKSSPYYSKGYWNLENSQKCIYYTKKELIYNLFLITNYQNWVFYPDFYKTHNKAKFGNLFASKASDVSHPWVYLQYLKIIFP